MSTTTNNMFDLMDQAAETYMSALRAGVKFQEDLAKSWTDMAGKPGSPGEWAGQFQKAATDMTAKMRDEAEVAFKQMEENTRQSVELLKQATETGQALATPQGQQKLQELWESSLTAMRQNAEAAVEANNRLLHAWASLLHTNGESGETK